MPTQFLAHPENGKLLILGDSILFVVAPAVGPAPEAAATGETTEPAPRKTEPRPARKKPAMPTRKSKKDTSGTAVEKPDGDLRP